MRKKEQEEEPEEEPEEETEEETPKKKKEKWVVSLVITDEDKPPKKVLTRGEETLDWYGAIANLMNEVETIKKGMLD